MVGGASIKHFLFSPDSWLWQPNRSLLYWITTAVLALAIGVTVWHILDVDLAYTVSYEASTGKVTNVASHTGQLYTLANGSLMVPDLQEKMPAGVRFEGSLPVYVAVDRSTFASKVLIRLLAVPMDLLILALIWLFRRVALTAVGTPKAPANPFVWTNVRRLRIIAALVVVAPVIDSWSHIALLELVRPTLQEFSMLGWDVTSFLLPAGIGLVLAVLAEVFAAGIRLREDVEGLV
jgi:DUF2975 family protein